MSHEKLLKEYNQWRRGDDGYEMPDPTAIGIAIDSVLAQLAALKEENERLKARVAEPVAVLLIGETEHTKQGWELGDWDIEPNPTAIEAFAKLAEPGAYQLYLAPQPAPDVSALVGALEVMTRVFSPRNGEPGPDMHAETEAHQLATAALAAHRKGDQP